MYRGENIDITIKGDSEFNLDKLDFRVLVYPDKKLEDAIILPKSESEKLGDNYYKVSLGYEQTKEMSLGLYSIEVLLEEDDERKIYAKSRVFSLLDSASKDID